jgi:hypothetical protein
LSTTSSIHLFAPTAASAQEPARHAKVMFAVEMTALALMLVADAIWRWRYAKNVVRADGVVTVERWAHRHQL